MRTTDRQTDRQTEGYADLLFAVPVLYVHSAKGAEWSTVCSIDPFSKCPFQTHSHQPLPTKNPCLFFVFQSARNKQTNQEQLIVFY